MATAVGVQAGIIQAGAKPSAPPRRGWMDNLRVAVIAGVIVCHVAASYAIPVPWYYEERTANTVTVAVLSALFGPAVFYAMAVLFLIAGILTPRSLTRKGPGGFIRDRLVRLGVPLAVSTAILVPLTALIGALGEGKLEPRGLGLFLAQQAQDLDTGVMWFAAALLVLSIAYAGFRWVSPARPRVVEHLRWRHLGGAAAAIAVTSFVVRLEWPALSATPLHLNLWDWPTMAALFVVGIALGATAAATVFFGAVVLTGDDRLLGGLHPQALLLPVIEGALAVGMSVWLAGWFEHRWNQHGPLPVALGRSSYAAYVLHPPVIVLLGVALRPVATVAEVKLIVVAALGVMASFTIGWLLTRVRPLARVV